MKNKELYYFIETVGLKKLIHLEEYEELKNKTFFLPKKASIRNRMWHLLNGSDIPICENNECQSEVKWSRKKLNYNIFCSSKCQCSSEEYKENQKSIFIEKYGVDNPMKVNKFKEKCLNKNNENYSDEKKLNAINEKRKKTTMERYGVENVFCDVDKIRKANVEKYGVENVNQQHMDMILCNVDNIEYMNSVLKMNSVQIGNELGISKSAVCRILKRNNVDIKKHVVSSGQEEIFSYIESLGVNCYSNDRTILDGLELDIVIPSHKIAIEYCGLYWHDHNHKDNKYHQNKYNLSKQKGFTLLTIFEDEWLHKSELVKKMICHKLNETEYKIGARQTLIKNVDNKTVKNFLNKNHIQGAVNYSYAYGLFTNNNLVALITLIKRNDSLEINRYCTNMSVVGGFTKLLKYIKNNHSEIDKVYTFADLRWGYGDLYIKSGMTEEKIIPPDYHYVKGNYRYHKFNFRHSKLKRKFENYDKNKTEFENCIRNGYRRIYDCGKIKFSLDIKKALN